MRTIVFFVLLLSLFSCNSKKEIRKNFYKVGVSQISINPEIGSFIAGDRQNRKFTGIHDSLFVKAIVVSDSISSIALITFDCIGMLYPVLEDIRDVVSKKIPSSEFDVSRIVMTSTHTHSGPDVVGIWGPDQLTTGVDSLYMAKVVSASADAIMEAWTNQTKAKGYYAESVFGEDWVYNISDSLNLDRSLKVIQFKDEKNNSLATLTNFACHPTFMDGTNSEVSADYVAGLYTTLDTNIGGVNFFLQGAIGGWVQPEYETKTFENALYRGSELGNDVLKMLNAPKTLNSTGLNFSSKKIRLPVSNEGFQQLTSLGVIKRDMKAGVLTEIALFGIGEALFVTHPGETTPTHSLDSKKLMKTEGPKFILGLGMDALGYILTPEFFEKEPRVKHSNYLKSMSIDPQAGPLILQTIEELSQN
ncbi:neutral/alkaline non-lysosomal ceramidase N-terminal domain-containing protein [Eudoraea chungangensis]|uniref:neutral/alkaline non-lysosomal ceramidase N-terminal domain-containing protein n=1 Tax=Eudoraea chungangensis TaxID=1481905 RepID=UPI0023EBE2C6|nr:neutral/alkaline non-lysosomal ceramidase N-terminal domain-containing protein [Eudoraea chungangensis]